MDYRSVPTGECAGAAIWPASGVERPPQAAATRPPHHRVGRGGGVAAVAPMQTRHYNIAKEPARE